MAVLPLQEQADLRADLLAVYNRPDLFVRHFLGVETLRTWQEEAWLEIGRRFARGDRRVRVLVRTCHYAGKTFFAAGTLLWAMVTRPGARGLTLAQTWHGVENLIWPEVHKFYDRSPFKKMEFGKLLETGIYFDPTWFALGASSDHSENLEGHHSDTFAIRIVDEAKAVPPETYIATTGLLNAPLALDLWISTPAKEEGDFYERDMDGDPGVIRAVVNVDDLIRDPRLSPQDRAGNIAWKAECAASWGEDSAWYRSRVMAEYITEPEGSLFPVAWIERAMSQEWNISGPVIAGMDVAGSVDGDQSAVALACSDGTRTQVFSVTAWHERDTMKSKGRALAIARPARATLRLDGIGLGQTLADVLRNEGHPVEVYRSYERPKDTEAYANRKAEDAFTLRRLMEKGLLRLPNDPALKRQMKQMKFAIKTTGKIAIIDPPDSPDLADAVLIACARPRVGFAMYEAEDY